MEFCYLNLNSGWGYAWWFPVAYALMTILIIAIYGKAFLNRFFSFPKSASLKNKLPVLFGAALLGRGIALYSIFLPLKHDSLWLWVGVFIFVIGILLTAIAMINFATTSQDLPVRKGLFRISRNPIQVLAIFMCLGVGIATGSWIILGACLLLAGISYPSIRAQERHCLETYGEVYREYMKSTPRYLLFGL